MAINYAYASQTLENMDRNIAGDNSFKILVWGVAENGTNGLAISADNIDQLGYAPRITHIVNRLLSKKRNGCFYSSRCYSKRK